MSFGQSSTFADKLRDLCENPHSDERSLLEHHSKLIDFEDKYAENLAKFEAKEIADCIWKLWGASEGYWATYCQDATSEAEVDSQSADSIEPIDPFANEDDIEVHAGLDASGSLADSDIDDAESF